MKLEKGSKAPSFEAVDSDGKEWRIPECLEDRALVMVFLRHLGCPLCKRRIDELGVDYDRFRDAGAELLAIVESTGPRIAKYARKRPVPYPIIGNKDKSLYKLYGVGRGGWRAFLAPRVFSESAKATLKGYMHGKFEGDELQKPAEFIIAPDGNIAWAHYGEDIADSSSNDTILKELKALG